MRVLLDIPEEGLCGLSRKYFEQVCSFLSHELGNNFLFSKRVGVGVSSASLEEMAVLNEQSLKKTGPTDILSFPTYHNKETVESIQSDEFFLGDIVLCESVIRRDAQKDGVSYEHEMAFVFSHGILHLLGYEHGEEMFALQDKVCENMKKEKLWK